MDTGVCLLCEPRVSTNKTRARFVTAANAASAKRRDARNAYHIHLLPAAAPKCLMARPSSKPGSKKTVRTLTPYMSKIAKNTGPDTSINSEAAVLLSKMLENLQNRLIVKSAHIARSSKSGTLTNKHVLCGARASLPMSMEGPLSEFVDGAVTRFAKPPAVESA